MKRSLIVPIVAVGLLAAGAGSAPPAGAQTNLKVLSVPPTALKPADYINDVLAWVSNADGFYFANNLSAPVDSFAYAPLNLPQGARVKSLTVYYMDNACGINQELVVSLMRHELTTGKIQVMAEVTTEGVPCIIDRRTVEDLKVANAVVDNHRFSYALFVRFFDGIDRLRFHGAKIIYQ